MFNQKKWCVLLAAILLGLAAEVFAPEVAVRTAEAMECTDVKNCTRMHALDEPVCGESEPLARICTEDIWKAVYQEVMTNDLVLMSSSTDHIVNYHNKRFAITEDDYQVLLRIVEAESGGEDIMGRMLVANVILNRLEAGFGGTTISEVVFAEGQFSPVSDGRIFRVVPTEVTIEAVERVLDGEDYSEGALYFMCRATASWRGARWFDRNLKFLLKYGNHEFFGEWN